MLPTAPLPRPRTLLFDWRATLVDTLDAMYYALDEVLPRLAALGLLDRLVPAGASRTEDDARLVRYVRENAGLHPRIRAERRISRTDIFDLLFGDDEQAKGIAHAEFDRLYARHDGPVKPLETGARERLDELRALGLTLGVISNRAQRFMTHEIDTVDGSGWRGLFDVVVCGDEVAHRKPHPDLLVEACRRAATPCGASCWYVGDSVADMVAGKRAGATGIFYNGAGWDAAWIDKIFPGTDRHPQQPDHVVRDLAGLLELVRAAPG